DYNVKAPEVDVKAPKPKSKGFFARVKNNISGAFDSDKDVKVKADMKSPDVKAPDVNLDYDHDANLGTSVDYEVPATIVPESEVDVNLKAPNVNLGGAANYDVDVKRPKVDTDLDADANLEVHTPDINMPTVNKPNVDLPDNDLPDIKSSDIERPSMNIKAPDVNAGGDVDVGNIDIDADMKAPEIDIETKKIDVDASVKAPKEGFFSRMKSNISDVLDLSKDNDEKVKEEQAPNVVVPDVDDAVGHDVKGPAEYSTPKPVVIIDSEDAEVKPIGTSLSHPAYSSRKVRSRDYDLTTPTLSSSNYAPGEMEWDYDESSEDSLSEASFKDEESDVSETGFDLEVPDDYKSSEAVNQPAVDVNLPSVKGGIEINGSEKFYQPDGSNQRHSAQSDDDSYVVLDDVPPPPPPLSDEIVAKVEASEKEEKVKPRGFLSSLRETISNALELNDDENKARSEVAVTPPSTSVEAESSTGISTNREIEQTEL
ncbi:unnamed protein product, partial [Owenia fusiformis]